MMELREQAERGGERALRRLEDQTDVAMRLVRA